MDYLLNNRNESFNYYFDNVEDYMEIIPKKEVKVIKIAKIEAKKKYEEKLEKTIQKKQTKNAEKKLLENKIKMLESQKDNRLDFIKHKKLYNNIANELLPLINSVKKDNNLLTKNKQKLFYNYNVLKTHYSRISICQKKLINDTLPLAEKFDAYVTETINKINKNYNYINNFFLSVKSKDKLAKMTENKEM